ncbi:hypothetical protein CXG81DRAFT_15660 [Caulochytrium protostelioides]|uniref:Carboxypeptidase S n=1 Tax=Caulochytrium protostelioides TaxID=1555241 RepID=A0A4P9X0Y5_9FUNG|nr:carboxypeptidase S [Caulochytrium protostelioides]RKO98625.1 hypothetical protein CXG81DRAFT_15660 [Caulochytrium protostelioides]|eukprot:RKO98625.1 hypothetical protein CXG81DRAFT_15660 [Caulochytrium protostelioides]
MYHQLTSDDYIQQAAERLSSAVQFPTISYDDMRNHTPHSAFALPNKGKDDDDDLDRRRYAPFARFHEWIIKTYPRVHSSLKREVINSYALVYTWDAAEGAPASTDDGKKPLLLMAHMDVVPVAGYPDHVEGWTYPPFSGRIASGRVWGRGSADTKNSLTAILDAVEALLEAEFKPHRPIVIAFGFDEEISGLSGAGHVMPVLAERYGENGFGMVVDEGMGFDPTLSEEARSKGIEMALVAVAEKGYVDLEITLQTPGGHSSLPPDHTGIGLAALFIAEAEKDAPQSFRPVLERDANPFHASLSCVAAWDPGAPAELRDAVANDDTDALTRFVARDTLYQYMIRTSQAIDVISGGAKVNALPERTTFRVNHRVGMHQSTGAVLTRWAQLGTAFANQWQLEFRLLDEHEALPSLKDDGAHRRGLLTVRPLPGRLEPSPTSPAHTDAKYYQMLAGTIRHVFARHPHANVTAPAADEPHVGSLVLVAPTLMPANTDTRFTWSLTPNIFRFSGVRPDASANVHTVDEYMDIRNHAEVIRFYYELIRNWSALK